MLKFLTKISNFGKFFNEFYASLSKPSTWKAGFTAKEAMFAEMAKTGEMMEKVTLDHSHPKIAGLAKAFEEMLEHPLSKQFIKEKPNIYIQKAAPTTLEALMGGGGGGGGSPAVVTPNTIVFPQSVIEALEPQELKAALGHEMGHIIRADVHPNRALKNILRPSNQKMERSADQIGVMLSGEPEATNTGLRKITQLVQESLAPSVSILPKPLARMANSLTERTVKHGSRIYPGRASREFLVKRTGEALKDGNKEFVEEEIRRRILATRDEALIPR